jgi:ferrous iron transport protein B
LWVKLVHFVICFLFYSIHHTPGQWGNGAIKNEVGTRWVIFAALWSFTLAYLSTVACYQLAVFSSQPVDSFISIVVIMAVFFSIYYALKRAGKNILTIPTLVSYR